jgi:hypothetical protein
MLKALAKRPEDRFRSTQEMFASACMAVGSDIDSMPERFVLAAGRIDGNSDIAKVVITSPEDRRQELKESYGPIRIPKKAFIFGGIFLVIFVVFGIGNLSDTYIRSNLEPTLTQTSNDVQTSIIYGETGDITSPTSSFLYEGTKTNENVSVSTTSNPRTDIPKPTETSPSTPNPLEVVQEKYIAYLYSDDISLAQEYQSLLETFLIPTDIILLGDVINGFSLSKYDLIIIGPDTDRNSANGHAGIWVEKGLTNLAQGWSQPILALGEGGIIFLESQKLDIGFRHGSYMPQDVAQGYTSGGVIIVEKDHPIWNTPFQIPETLPTIYHPPSGWVQIHIPAISNVLNVNVLGKAEGDNSSANLIQQGKFLLWGFQSGPNHMTEKGKKLFINLMDYLLKQDNWVSETVTLVPNETHSIGSTPTIIPGAPWHVTFEYRFPPGFWSEGTHEYTFGISCTFWGETSNINNSFKVSDNAEVFPDVIYLRVNKVTDVPSANVSASDRTISVIHPSQPTVAELNIKFNSLSEAASAEEDCNIEFSWDGLSSYMLRASPPYQR